MSDETRTCAAHAGGAHRCRRTVVKAEVGYGLCAIHYNLLAAHGAVRVVSEDTGEVSMIVTTPVGYRVQKGLLGL